MLEHGTKCLEYPSRQLLRRNRALPATRRRLHSSFWHHGAGDLDLPVWWATVLDTCFNVVATNPPNSQRISKWGHGLMSSFNHKVLKSLHPAKTVSFMRRLSRLRTNGQPAVFGLCQDALTTIRRYSSVNPVAGRGVGIKSLGQHLQVDTVGDSCRPENTRTKAVAHGRRFNAGVSMDRSANRKPKVGPILRRLSEKLKAGLPEPDDAEAFEAIWRIYLQLEEPSNLEASAVNLLAAYLSFSARQEDSARIKNLFRLHKLPDSSVPESLLIQRLHSGSPQLMVATFVEAVEARAPIGFGAAALLARLIREQRWALAVKIMRKWPTASQDGYSPRSTMWYFVHRLPRTLTLARSLLRNSDQKGPAITELDTSEGRAMLSHIIHGAGLQAFTSQPAEVCQLFQDAYKSGLIHSGTFLNVMQQHVGHALRTVAGRAGDLNRRQALFSLYKTFREIPDARPNEIFLSTMLSVLARPHSKPEIDPQLLLEDYQRLHGKLNGHASAALLRLFAREKSVEDVQKFFDDLPQDASSVAIPMTSLLTLYARRGEISKVEEQFNRISAEFKAKPDINCWNVLLNAYAKAGMADKALDCFNRLRRTELQTDQYTFGILLHMFAMNGDTDSVLEYLELAKSEGVAITSVMSASLVLAHIKSGNLKAAEEATMLITNASKEGRLDGPLTIPWVFLLTAHALRRNLAETVRVFRLMQTYGVPQDSHAYGALIQALSLVHQTLAAWKLLKVVMPAKDIPTYPQHYAYVMAGFIRQMQVSRALRVYQDMQSMGMKPDAACKLQYLSACSLQNRNNPHPGYVRRLVSQIMDGYDQAAEPHRAPKFSFGARTLGFSDEVDAYFETLILNFGTRNLREVMDEVVEEYNRRRSSHRRDEPMPLRLLSAMMTAQLRAGEFEGIQESWDKCFEQAVVILNAASPTRPPAAGAITNERGDESNLEELGDRLGTALSYEQRALLSKPLLPYLQSLEATSQHQRAQDTVKSLLQHGFTLDNIAWNTYIRTLASSPQAQHIIQAFQLCEEKLMPNFPGWKDRAWLVPNRQRRARWEGGFDYMKDVTLGHGPSGERYLSKLMPQYKTICTLQDVYLKLRNAEKSPSGRGADGIDRAMGTVGGEELRLTATGLRQLSPSTVKAIEDMPQIEIPTQRMPRDSLPSRIQSRPPLNTKSRVTGETSARKEFRWLPDDIPEALRSESGDKARERRQNSVEAEIESLVGS